MENKQKSLRMPDAEEFSISTERPPPPPNPSAKFNTLDHDQLRSLVDSVRDGLAVIDTDDRLQYVNQELCRLLGYPAEELIGRFGREFISGADQHFYGKQLAHRAAGGKQRYEVNCLTKQGTTVLVLVSPAPLLDAQGIRVGSFAVVTDLSSVRHMEQVMIRERTLLQTLMNHMPDSIYVKDTQGKYITANDAHCAFVGAHDVHEIIGSTTRDFFGDGAFPPHYQEDKHVIQTGTPLLAQEKKILDKLGQERWLEVTKLPLKDNNGIITGIVGVERDVTASKITEGAARAAARMEATSALAGGISHNFNNLMTIVLANAELLDLNLTPNAKNNGMLRSIIDAAEQAANLAKQLVAFARGGKNRPADVMLNEIIKDILILDRHSFSNNITFESQLDETLYATHADPVQLGQVVLALTINAAQAITDVGNITITTKNVELGENDCAKLHLLTPGPHVYLSVIDNGCGMEPEMCDRVFDPFFGTKTTGRGLGLAAVYGTIKNHDGHIAIKSVPGKGTQVEIYLPAASVQEVDNNGAFDPNLRGEESVLIVDDEPTARLIPKNVLQSLGYTVCEAENGKQAIDIAKRTNRQIDIILLDMVMPVLSGPEAFPILRREQPNAKIILCSGFCLNDITQKVLELGAHSFLEKPFHANNLAKVIRKALDMNHASTA